MCRHCERLVDDVAMRPAIHALMTETARRLSEKSGIALTADDINVRFEIDVPEWRPNPFAENERERRLVHDFLTSDLPRPST